MLLNMALQATADTKASISIISFLLTEKMMMQCSTKYNLIKCINDVVEKIMLTEHLQYHERLLQGSLKSGLQSPKACGLLLSSNQPEKKSVVVCICTSKRTF